MYTYVYLLHMCFLVYKCASLYTLIGETLVCRYLFLMLQKTENKPLQTSASPINTCASWNCTPRTRE